MITAEEIAFLYGHPTCDLLEMLKSLETYIPYAIEQGWLAYIPDKEERVSLIKSELGRRGAFD
jgi:hypothetical protein